MDDRWHPRVGARVRVETKENALNPDGVWMLLDRSPEATSAWWLYPHDDTSRAWAAAHRSELITGCVSVLGNRLLPTYLIKNG